MSGRKRTRSQSREEVKVPSNGAAAGDSTRLCSSVLAAPLSSDELAVQERNSVDYSVK